MLDDLCFFLRARKAVTLKDVGVDPPGIPEQSREGVLDRILKKNTA